MSEKSTPGSVGQAFVKHSRRRWMYLVYILIWLIGSVAIGVPVLTGLVGVLNQLPPATRLIFYLMPPVLSALLVLGVLQIVAMYRYWYGPR
ncbi:MAG: hypothetical protein ACRDIY_22275 [Chloroflexota bacterium]